jgi:hypothetical protein
MSTWLLPGGAAVAAVAALALFLTSQPAKRGRAIEDTVADIAARARPPEVQDVATTQWVEEHFEPGVALPTFAEAKVDRWGARLADVGDREALQLYYRVTTPEGVSRDLQVIIFDARNMNLEGGRRVEMNDRVLRYGVFRRRSLVSYVDGRDRAYVFTSSQLAPEQLVELVGTSSLLMQVRDDERRP